MKFEARIRMSQEYNLNLGLCRLLDFWNICSFLLVFAAVITYSEAMDEELFTSDLKPIPSITLDMSQELQHSTLETKTADIEFLLELRKKIDEEIYLRKSTANNSLETTPFITKMGKKKGNEGKSSALPGYVRNEMNTCIAGPQFFFTVGNHVKEYSFLILEGTPALATFLIDLKKMVDLQYCLRPNNEGLFNSVQKLRKDYNILNNLVDPANTASQLERIGKKILKRFDNDFEDIMNRYEEQHRAMVIIQQELLELYAAKRLRLEEIRRTNDNPERAEDGKFPAPIVSYVVMNEPKMLEDSLAFFKKHLSLVQDIEKERKSFLDCMVNLLKRTSLQEKVRKCLPLYPPLMDSFILEAKLIKEKELKLQNRKKSFGKIKHEKEKNSSEQDLGPLRKQNQEKEGKEEGKRVSPQRIKYSLNLHRKTPKGEGERPGTPKQKTSLSPDRSRGGADNSSSSHSPDVSPTTGKGSLSNTTASGDNKFD